MYTSENAPFLTLYDTDGFALININKYRVALFDFISEFDKKEFDKLIHCIWYCLTGTHFEFAEIDFLRKMNDKFLNIPIIIVYTHFMDEEIIKDVEFFLKEELEIKYIFIDILAKEKGFKKFNSSFKIKPHSFDKLIKNSLIVTKESIYNLIDIKGILRDLIKEKSNININNENLNNLNNEFKKKILNYNFDEIGAKIEKYIEIFKNE